MPLSITHALARWLTNYDDQRSLGSRLRARRAAPLIAMIEAVARQHGHVEIIDIGGAEFYWGIVPAELLQRHRVSITIVNVAGSEIKPDHGPFKFREGDGCDLAAYGDRSFHIAHSNSVIEHVGDWERMVRFASEMHRVAERFFVQTPNFWFPIEPHFMSPFFHWLPVPMRVWLVLHFRLGHWKRADTVDDAVRIVESARLLNRRMFATLFAGAEITTERVLGLAKSFVAIKR